MKESTEEKVLTASQRKKSGTKKKHDGTGNNHGTDDAVECGTVYFPIDLFDRS